jgi:multicomponent Na+:H+ antiporter subunit E
VANIITIFMMALVWTFLVSDLRAYNFVVGALIGVLILAVIQHGEPYSFASRIRAFIQFAFRFFIELVIANFTIAKLTLRPNIVLHPHIIAIPLRVKSDQAISLLAMTITLLPGTVAMGVSDDKQTLYAHAIGIEDVTQAQASVSKIESLILGFMK